MKHFVLYTILVCIAFLNVPRSFVHDCDHHQKFLANNGDDWDVSVDQDDCFVCEFQLDFFEVPNFKLPQFASKKNFKPAEVAYQNAPVQYINALSLRGPPIFV